MKMFTRLIVVCLGLMFAASTVFSSETAASLPKVFRADPHALAAAKASLASGQAEFQPVFQRLLAGARRALAMKPVSVMDKDQLPPSGDKHDFLSQAPYFWRDTNSPDGRYIHRDGQRNPEASKDPDARHLGAVCSSVQTLALAYYFTGDEKYAAKAADIMRTWFLDPKTRMNPNLNYGQGIPGQVAGRPEGLISARGFVQLADGLGLLAESKSWPAADRTEMTVWLGQYFNWLTTNPLALREGKAANNHGTFYDTQIAAIGLFLGKTNLVTELLLKDRKTRIARQIEPDGRQPRELARTLSFDYSLFNLRALFDLASIGQNAGVDLWHYETPDGRSILKAIQFMAGYADPQKNWPYRQIHEPNREDMAELLLRASGVYSNSEISKALQFFPSKKLAGNSACLLFKVAPTRN